MFKTISAGIGRDTDFPERQHRLDVLGRVLDGTLYDHLLYPFSQERNEGTNEYIPVFKRRPSVRYRLCGTVVDDSVSLLFADGRFPGVDCANEETREKLQAVIKDAKLAQVMIQAATLGSVGSICLHLRVLKGRIFVDVMPTQFLTPAWDPEAPDTLQSVTERYKVKGSVLADMGYDIAPDDMGAMFWFQRVWDALAENWFQPVKVKDKEAAKSPPRDDARSTNHGLGFVPLIWIKNLPGGDAIDGAPTMVREAIETNIEIDYQLSQAGRGLRYAADPTLLIKEPADTDGQLIRSASQALVVSEGGDAKLLEINGTAAAAVVEYCRAMRELALESMHGNRANADKLSAAQSGRAMELMNQALIWLADRLRISYGDGGILQLLRMIVKISQKIDLIVDGKPLGPIGSDEPVTLRWPKWFAPTYADSLTQAQTLETLTTTGLMSTETAVKALASDYDIEDPEAELAQIAKDKADQVEQAGQLAQATKPPREPLSNSED